jgi:2-polyprenyl-3-methyl-5-hydroxy-6-metoxy-1,4-benzoquinol methylase
MTVADLGAGGGHILASLKARNRYAVELNSYARKQIEKVYPRMIKSVPFVEELSDNSVDIFYTTSVIEHVECPLTEIREMYHKIKPGGTIIMFVPALVPENVVVCLALSLTR